MNFVHNFRLPQSVKLRITLFWTDFAWDSQSSDNSSSFVDNAKNTLAKHNFTLDVIPTAKTAEMTLNYQHEIQNEEDAGQVRNLAHQAYNESNHPGANGRLPVIFCPIWENYHGGGNGEAEFGSTYRGLVDGVDWLPFVIINTRKMPGSKNTLIHEMGHAAGLALDDTHEVGTASTGNFLNKYGLNNDQSEMLCCQVAALAQAYFAEPQWLPDADFKRKCSIATSCRSKFGSRWS